MDGTSTPHPANDVRVKVQYEYGRESHEMIIANSTTFSNFKNMAIFELHQTNGLGSWNNCLQGTDISEMAQRLQLTCLNKYELVDEELTLAQANVQDGALFVLSVKNEYDEKKFGTTFHETVSSDTDHALTMETVQKYTADLVHTPKTPHCPSHKADYNFSCKLLERRVLQTLAHGSLRVLGATKATEDAFTAILERLERRHRTSIKPDSVQRLMSLGIPESKAVMALKQKVSVDDAANWLADYNLANEPPPPDNRSLSPSDDPVEVLMPRFWHFRRQYFHVKQEHFDTLKSLGYDSTRVFDALMQLDNELGDARKLLEKEVDSGKDLLYSSLSRKNTIIEKLYTKSSILIGLHKPKVLFALLALCENPSNSNLWLSDPDTTDIVKSIQRVQNEERYNEKNVADLL